ncbi:MAG: hypothetical protein KC561_03995 [Myxococcales bacterium]|nr:hypothetical protein [Myxococcales bacterium]
MTLTDWAISFAITQAIEVPIYALAFRRAGRTPLVSISLAFLASTLTHPVLWLVWERVDLPYWYRLASLELVVWGVETVYCRLLSLQRPVLWAFAANTASIAGGFFYQALQSH